MQLPRTLLLPVAFTEGAAVMAVELLGAKLIAPWFGTSLYVWASVLGVTMMGLAGGYYAGGWLSSRSPGRRTLGIQFALAALFIALMPLSSHLVLSLTQAWDVRAGSLLSALVFLFPPMFLLGSCSPMMVHLSAAEGDTAGKASGTIYAVSTLGGILSTFLTGFWLIPDWGLRKPAWLFAALLCLCALLLLLRSPRSIRALPLILLPLLPAAFSALAFTPRTGSPHTVRTVSEGLLGQVAVTDQTDENGDTLRSLFINGLPQSVIRLPGYCTAHRYVDEMSTLAGIYPKGAHSLVLGMGAGSMLRELILLGHQVEVVELDARFPALARDWFGVPVEDATVVVDDARHYLNRLPEREYYDFITMDVFFGDNPPGHVISLEAMQKTWRILRRGGMFLIFFPGPILGEKGLPAQILIQTMRAAGFEVAVLSAPGLGFGGRVFIGTKTPFEYSRYPIRHNTRCVSASLPQRWLPYVNAFELNTEKTYSDEYPLVENILIPVEVTRQVFD